MTGYCLNIGLNHCDPNAYPGWDSTLAGCVNDAVAMNKLATAAHFKTRHLIDSQATSTAVLEAIAAMAKTCRAGDLALITYSGHGGQVPDTNGDEPDGMDETWVLYDRQVCDDELGAMYERFSPGVRVLVVADNCHAGSVMRMVLNLATRHALAKSMMGKDMWPRGVMVAASKPRAMPQSQVDRDVVRHRSTYRLAQSLTRGTTRSSDFAASLILLAACHDSQLSYDGTSNGAFTAALLKVWNNGAFTGNYKTFMAAISDLMPPDQTPQLSTRGDTTKFELERPFTLAPSSANGAPSTGSSRPSIREGSRGPDVKYLQERLRVHGFEVTVDGVFGPGTTRAVLAFQASEGLTADGGVGPLTWSALEAAPAEEEPTEAGWSDTSDDPEGDDPEGDDPEGDDPEGDPAEVGWSDTSDDPEGDDPEGDPAEVGWSDTSDDPEGDDPEGDDPEGDPAEVGWSDTSDDPEGDDPEGYDPEGDPTEVGWSDTSDDPEGAWDAGEREIRTPATPATTFGGRWASPSEIYEALAPGCRGGQVRNAQLIMRNHGYRGPNDGVYSIRMATAVRAIQRAEGLPQTGVIDGRTWATMSALRARR